MKVFKGAKCENGQIKWNQISWIKWTKRGRGRIIL